MIVGREWSQDKLQGKSVGCASFLDWGKYGKFGDSVHSLGSGQVIRKMAFMFIKMNRIHGQGQVWNGN